MKEIKAPTSFTKEVNQFYIFLAGSIEMGTAENWQKQVADALFPWYGFVLLNPLVSLRTATIPIRVRGF